MANADFARIQSFFRGRLFCNEPQYPDYEAIANYFIDWSLKYVKITLKYYVDGSAEDEEDKRPYTLKTLVRCGQHQ